MWFAREIIVLDTHEAADKAREDLLIPPVAGAKDGMIRRVHQVDPSGTERNATLLMRMPEQNNIFNARGDV